MKLEILLEVIKTPFIPFPGKNPCFPNPCQNGGNCHADGDDFTCKCDYGYAGKKCELQTGESVNVG